MTTNERAVLFDAKAGDSTGPVWIQIAKCGQWQGHPSGPFQLGPKEFGEIVSAFRASDNKRVPIDFEHVSEMDPREGNIPTVGAPAQGWMIDLDNRGAAGLWALAEWGKLAREYIRAGQYRFFSPTIRFNARDPKSGERRGCRLSSGALTNQPFLDGMAPLTAKDASEHDSVTNEHNDMPISKEQLDAALAQLDRRGAAPAAEHNDARAALAKQEAELTRLREFEQAIVSERVTLAFNAYKDARQLTREDRDSMAIVLRSNPEEFERMFPRISVTSNLTDADGEQPSTESTTMNTVEDLVLKCHRGQASIVDLARAIRTESNVGEEKSFAMAEIAIRGGSPTANAKEVAAARLCAVNEDLIDECGGSIVKLADRLVADKRAMGREHAFVMAERMLRNR